MSDDDLSEDLSRPTLPFNIQAEFLYLIQKVVNDNPETNLSDLSFMVLHEVQGRRPELWNYLAEQLAEDWVNEHFLAALSIRERDMEKVSQESVLWGELAPEERAADERAADERAAEDLLLARGLTRTVKRPRRKRRES